ncbi:MAG: DUF4326 domain-containing protein, partial [Sulfobacillus sp.]
MDTSVVHHKKTSCDVYVGRPSIWGNPFTIGRDGSRADVIAAYRHWIMREPKLLARIPELRGKILGCWCAPRPCHAEVLAELARLSDRQLAVMVALAQVRTEVLASRDN